MLARVVETSTARPADAPTLRSLAYGGARCRPRSSSGRSTLFPDTDFVNAYGLTETSSTIAVLGPDDHRAAATATPRGARLGSAGRSSPASRSRSATRARAGAGEVGESGCAASRSRRVPRPGPWPTPRLVPDPRPGWIDDDGYLFIEGRADDTIIRGGENIAPAEIEDVLLDHPAVPTPPWSVSPTTSGVSASPPRSWCARRRRHRGELRGDARQLRGSKTPDRTRRAPVELPHTDTGKLLRREVLAGLLRAEVK